MRVEIEREVATKRSLIYIIRDGDPSWQWFPDVNGGPTWLQIEPGEKIKPSLKIDDEVWEALVSAILGLPTDQAPLADHLNDACAVRDRLLTMVEMGWEGMTRPPRLLTPPEAEAQR